MTRSVYVASPEGLTGKSAVALGLVDALTREVGSVGIFRPLTTVGTSSGGTDLVVDLLAEHPSISKQHAVVQFRYTEKRNEFGDRIGKVKPYLLDLESANGTSLNDSRIPDSRYLELRDKDMVRFGDSTREYVVMLAPKE